jgi:diguanylate cyclase (GGDEF)-like protein/putative nucleotidyltransferase with HDIG domain
VSLSIVPLGLMARTVVLPEVVVSRGVSAFDRDKEPFRARDKMSRRNGGEDKLSLHALRSAQPGPRKAANLFVFNDMETVGFARTMARQMLSLPHGERMKPISNQARAFIAFTLLVGFAILFTGLASGQWNDPPRFACYLLLALLASGLKINLPGVTGTMSIIFLFILIGVHELTFAETLVMSTLGTLIQCFWNAKVRPKPVQLGFNVASMSTSVAATYYVYHSPLAHLVGRNIPLMLALAASTFFLLNTIPVACVISLTEKKPLRKIWSQCYFWSFPYYLAGAAIAGLVSLCNKYLGWEASLLVLPVIYSIYRSYRLYLGRLEAQKSHVEEMASLHLRTIEALALAIEAKDHTTHDHLRRVQTYAVELGREMGLGEEDLDALRAAAVLHDIGKLAVPEHIISKPGRLTPEEFDKVKIHPVVGSEILERVQFPYPVVPIVRAHHEKWDGSGYPHGLREEEIPIGARILSAVDCLDALASDRQYRRALPLDQAMEVVSSEAGRSFDPKVVDLLKRRYIELERLAKGRTIERTKLSTELRIERGEAPAAGFEAEDTKAGATEGSSMDFLTSIASARQEVQMLFELSHELGNSLSLDETLSVLAVRLKRLIPYDSIAIYGVKDDRLVPEHVSGQNFRLFSSLRIPFGEGLSGWVAKNRKPILNGNPSVEPGYLNDPSKFSTLRSSLAVPLEGVNGVVGVLALYHADRDAFTKDHLRILLAISAKVALSIENALKYRMVESSATTDYLTGLPNARSLFLHLDSELARSKRSKSHIAVLVCDLDGFKEVNDRFGHLVGNQVLRAFAAKLKDACREYDYVARMGGDEFVVVLPGLKPDAVSETRERLRRLAMEAGREVCGNDLLSLSVGHAFYPDNGTDAEQLLSEADKRMYVVKRAFHDKLNNPVALMSFDCRPERVC